MNKAYFHDDTTILMLQLSAVVKLLPLIFRNYFIQGQFPRNWKKSNIVSVHKMGSKQLIQNYWKPHCCQSVVRYLKHSFSTYCTNVLKKIIYLARISPEAATRGVL